MESNENSLIPYRLAILGGGPAGCSVLVRAIRLGLIQELCQANEDGSVGVVVIDRDSKENFGKGKLGQYLVRGNTNAHRFVYNTATDLLDQSPPEKASGTSLQELWENPHGKCLRDCYGRSLPPLPVVGSFLAEVGKSTLCELERYSTRTSSLFGMDVVSITKLPSNLYEIRYKKYVYKEYSPDSSTKKLNESSKGIQNDSEIFSFLTKHIVLGLGGSQKIYSNVIPSKYHDKLILSDEFLTPSGVKLFKNKISNSKKKMGSNSKMKICIVGGSHSAFSSAWLLINGPILGHDHTNCSAKNCSMISSTTNEPSLSSLGDENKSLHSVPTNSDRISTSTRVFDSKMNIIPNISNIQHRNNFLSQFPSFDDKSTNSSLEGSTKASTTKSVIQDSHKNIPSYLKNRFATTSNTNVKYRSQSQNRIELKNPVPLINKKLNVLEKLPLRMGTDAVINQKATKVPLNTDINTDVHDMCSPQPMCNFAKHSIQIIHKSPIQLYFESEKEAKKFGSEEYQKFVSRSGKIFPFGGLRGDSKALYQNIINGNENRVKLTQLKSDPVSQQKTLESNFDSATIIIWAAGYTSNMLPFYDDNGNLMKLKYENNIVDVDSMARIKIIENESKQISDQKVDVDLIDTNLQSNSSPQNFENDKFLPNVYGIGLGFGLRTSLPSGEKDASNGRADAVHVFVKRAATLILSSILGIDRLVMSDMGSFEERKQKIKLLHEISTKIHLVEDNTSLPMEYNDNKQSDDDTLVMLNEFQQNKKKKKVTFAIELNQVKFFVPAEPLLSPYNSVLSDSETNNNLNKENFLIQTRQNQFKDYEEMFKISNHQTEFIEEDSIFLSNELKKIKRIKSPESELSNRIEQFVENLKNNTFITSRNKGSETDGNSIISDEQNSIVSTTDDGKNIYDSEDEIIEIKQLKIHNSSDELIKSIYPEINTGKSRFIIQIQPVLSLISKSIGMIPISTLDALRAMIQLENKINSSAYTVWQLSNRINDCMLPHILQQADRFVHVPKSLIKEFEESVSDYLFTMNEFIDQVAHIIDLVEGVLEVWEAKSNFSQASITSLLSNLSQIDEKPSSSVSNFYMMESKWSFKQGTHDLESLIKYLANTRESYFEKMYEDKDNLTNTIESLVEIIKHQQKLKNNLIEQKKRNTIIISLTNKTSNISHNENNIINKNYYKYERFQIESNIIKTNALLKHIATYITKFP